MSAFYINKRGEIEIDIFFVGLGGFLGSVGRYLVTILMNKAIPSFPFGTLLSNILASLIIGFIIGTERQTVALPNKTRLFLTTGLLGGLSTFSAFSLETVTMYESGRYIAAGGNVLLNISLCLIFVVIGMMLAKAVDM